MVRQGLVHHRLGFTLIELLVAMAIFSVISLTSFTILSTVITSDETLTAKNQRLNALDSAFIVMERDFLQLARRTVRLNGEAPISGFLHLDTDGIFSETSGVAFVRAGWTNPGLLLPRSNLQPVVYQLKDSQVQRLFFNFVDNVVGEEPKTRVLLEEVDELAFEFYYQNKWQESLSSESLPQAIAVIISSKDFGEIRRQFLLPASADVELQDEGSGNG
ncbi:type II secretion system minor pseudopilin GspJ [Thalassotalea atypica]|uniref:type II secretion system minor pseudopilin GspJ n=1 Tax=Thalassotalea atypica TaxID=2054316 RepID=UPI002573E689|nr:type II secretion system minor pseudopilin GspJ [Thalassotalea atypica]